jgi:hypothetical protein
MSSQKEWNMNFTMFRKKAIIFLVGFLFCGYNAFSNENPDEISNFYKELIEAGVLNPLQTLETIDENIYNIILNKLMEDDIIEEYYYGITVFISSNGNNTKQFTMRGYNAIKNLPEYSNYEIEFIRYTIYYYEIFLNKHSSSRGNPTTGRFFSLYFDKNNKIMRIIHMR